MGEAASVPREGFAVTERDVDYSNRSGSLWGRLRAYLWESVALLRSHLLKAIRSVLLPDWYSLGREAADELPCARPKCSFRAESSEIVCPRDGWLMRASSGGWRILRQGLSPYQPLTVPKPRTRLERILSFYNRVNSDPQRRYRPSPVDAVLPWFLTLGTVASFSLAIAIGPTTGALDTLLVLVLTLVVCEVAWRYPVLISTLRPASLILGGLILALHGRITYLLYALAAITLVASFLHLCRSQDLKVSRGRRYGPTDSALNEYESVKIHWLSSAAFFSSVLILPLTLLWHAPQQVWVLPITSIIVVVFTILGSELSHAMVGVDRAEPPRFTPQTGRGIPHEEDEGPPSPGDLVMAVTATSKRLALLIAQFVGDLCFTGRVIALPILLFSLGQFFLILACHRLGHYLVEGEFAGGLVAAISAAGAGTASMVLAVGFANANMLASVRNFGTFIQKKAWILGCMIVAIAAGVSAKHGSLNSDGGLGLLSLGLLMILCLRIAFSWILRRHPAIRTWKR